jgi:outer membrane cobalamin receptor
MRTVRRTSFAVAALAAAVFGATRPSPVGAAGSASDVAPANTAPTRAAIVASNSSRADSIRVLPPILVQATRPSPRSTLENRTGSATYLDVSALHDRVATAAEALDRVPGLHVNDYGGIGAFSTVSIRGSGSSQVNVYLDGVPLSRSALGVVNLADLPFAALDHIEVYRGFAPVELPGAGIGGGINLVTRSLAAPGPLQHQHRLVAGGGSFGTRRLSSANEFSAHGFGGVLVADMLESAGDFRFLFDNGTPLTPGDDRSVVRRNNWVRNDELLLRLCRTLGGGAEIRAADEWVRRVHGVPGPSMQSDIANGGAEWNLAWLEYAAPRLAHARLAVRGRVSSEWRRDRFYDPDSRIGLGAQDLRDVTRSETAHAGLRWLAPGLQHVSLELDARRERFEPFRPAAGPVQRRTTYEAGAEERLTLFGRLAFEAGVRAERQQDDFAGSLRNAYSSRPARGGQRTAVEPRIAARVRVAPGVHVRASTSRSHRTPSFLELFGDSGNVAGSTDLRVEHGTNRDVGLQFEAARRGVQARLEVSHFDNRARDLIAFIQQSQTTFVARNIGAARMRGEEWSWQLGAVSRRWSVDGGFTRLDAKDLGVDLTWYAGKSLPVRPARQLHTRVAVAGRGLELGYEFDYVGRDYLDRFNTKLVRRRGLHDVDARWDWRAAGLCLSVHNLGNDPASDIAGFPLPGRTFLLTTNYKL